MLLRLAILSLLLLAAVACKHNRRANTTVRERAAFDLICEPNELQLGVIDTEGARKLVNQIAVYGCDKKAVYVYYPDTDTWVIDGAISEVPGDFKLGERAGEGRNKKSRRKAQKAEKKGKMDAGY